MCGIAGAVTLQPTAWSPDEDYLARLLAPMAHRGPDGRGVWRSPGGRAGLGHLRLAIVDLTPQGAQPMSNEDGTLWLVFNGEIYNHRELRAELTATGRHRWRTDHCDTEVILHAFEEWGIGCLTRFNGMFAFALWDEPRQELWLARDRVGIKPLYHAEHHGRLVFASEIKALLADPEQPRAIDEEALFHYLSFLTTPAPRTMFAGIAKLPAAHWLRVGADGRRTLQRYWDPWDGVTPLTGQPEAALHAQVEQTLRQAVRWQRVADVPTGVFLSGGIDSSLNAALFAAGLDRPIDTFTIGYQGDHASYRNELPYAERMARHIGARWHNRLLEPEDLRQFVARMVWLQDEPVADPVCVPIYYVSELARRQRVIVCQVGEGADELFAGYPGWRTLARLERLSQVPLPRALRRLARDAYGRCRGRYGFRYEWLRRGAEGLPIFWGGAEAFPETHKQALLAPRLRRQFAGRSSWEVLAPLHARFLERAWEPSPLHWMTYLDLHLRLPELLLMRVDKMSMGASIETRVPFLDHELVRVALSLPSGAKLHRGELKRPLRQVARGLLPQELIDRPKQGFGVPLREWLLGGLGDTIRQQLDRFCAESGLLDGDQVRRFAATGPAAQVWFLYNLALWWQTFFNRE